MYSCRSLTHLQRNAHGIKEAMPNATTQAWKVATDSADGLDRSAMGTRPAVAPAIERPADARAILVRSRPSIVICGNKAVHAR
jgi:hypothetical protein